MGSFKIVSTRLLQVLTLRMYLCAVPRLCNGLVPIRCKDGTETECFEGSAHAHDAWAAHVCFSNFTGKEHALIRCF